VTLTAGAYDQYRAALDIGGALNDMAALRLNALYEESDSYRDFFSFERYGVNPTAAFRLGENTTLRAGYEYFEDYRVVDRGVPSENGRPWEDSRSAFFGNPDFNRAGAEVNVLTARLEHEFSDDLTLRNATVFGDYSKYYRNIHANSQVCVIANGCPLGQVDGDVALQGYQSTNNRENLFNQTDLIWRASTGSIEHTVLAGLEFGRQESYNARSSNFDALPTVNVNTNTTTTSTGLIPAGLQTDNTVEAGIAALHLQDQVRLNDQWQIVAGVRFDRFDLDYDNHLGADFSREDELVSPRLGVIYRPLEPLTFYASYSVSFLPQSGDQFSSLDANTAALEPEEFENLELGMKWDLTPDLALTAAIYRLDRTNTRHSPSPGVFVLTGAQRSEGFELGISGAVSDRWEIMGGYAYQEAEITSDTSVAAGRVIPLTPEHTFSLWNMVHLSPRFSIGLGATHQSDSFASINNAVTLPSFTRVDAALIYAITESVEAQLNVENLLDEDYWGTAHSDQNIMPGSPTAARLTLRARF
jgi:catecholate siderophore receptor